MQLEICASSFKSAQAAVKGGAHRIELCEDLTVGGITPATDILKRVIDQLQVETHVLIRARGGDFCYTAQEIEQMVFAIKVAKNTGATGVVFGALTYNKELDIPALKQLLKAAKGMDCSFHKAFDEVVNPTKVLENLIRLGFKRVLTSGQKDTAVAGLQNLVTWNQKYGQDIEIMPGGGIRPDNIAKFLDHNFKSVHSAAIPKNNIETSLEVVASLKASIAS